MTTDGGINQLLMKRLPRFHWQRIETGGVGRGIPDLNYCVGGIEGWVEGKRVTSGRRLDSPLSPEQSAWIERRARAGGRVTIAVRRKVPAGPRRGEAVDELWLFGPKAARGLISEPVSDRFFDFLLMTPNGPSHWDWNMVELILTREIAV